ncbi:MAG: 2-succinyl-5-enolpyruvyl-6-hydroxy-3-cyclohexene-1-carboxylic-acid synthase [Ignavibacteriales bacterium]|nr:2-succinyl-5-enolpyruvyl-6-hydroxy-3-cyclohexene-1-carboxylic-acid synthase [Ignavibacteriales bacterium]
MKLSINRNTLWSDFFTNLLSSCGVKYVCLSPGSRSTPLTFSFASNEKFKSYVIVDERSSGFFALGLAKKSNTPVAIVTTSGTAVAELYPAIVEAYYQRIPLIVCTADRPVYLRDRGSNQTINQENIYKNQIRYFADAGLPDITLKRFNELKKISEDALAVAVSKDKGPVHLNFPFEKPFEPETYTDKVSLSFIEKISGIEFNNNFFDSAADKNSRVVDLSNKIQKCEKGLILCGYNSFNKKEVETILKFSDSTGYPIVADGSSQFRFGKHGKKNIINNFSALVRSDLFLEQFDHDIIVQFGSAPTSNVVNEFFKKSRAEKIIVNEFGDKNDPTLTAKKFIRYSVNEFCEPIIKKIGRRNSGWLNTILVLNKIAEQEKAKYFSNMPFNFEGKLAAGLIELLPNKVNLMISNSLSIRDIDFFASCSQKEINIFTNRGASGIDGINSTALGIAESANEPTVLITGDLAFYHDLNGLHNSLKYNIPLTIILVNNNGGGIFESLPISSYGEIFEKNFRTPLNLNFVRFVKGYGGTYFKVRTKKEFELKLGAAVKSKKLTVIEIVTDSKKSKQMRNNYWQLAAEKIKIAINANKN